MYVKKKKKKKQASLPAQFMSGAERPTGNSPGPPDGHSGPGCICMEVYVCASVYRCICMEVYMYVRVFIGVYAWKFLCMCECLEVYMYVRVFIGVYV